MKKYKYVVSILMFTLFLSACNNHIGNSKEYEEAFGKTPPIGSTTYVYITFEEAISEFATHVVIAEYIGSEQFRNNLMVYEFLVLDHILGETSDRIFVYKPYGWDISVTYNYRDIDFGYEDLKFTRNVKYMLPLISINDPYSELHKDGFQFIRNIAVNLDNLEGSTMYSEPLVLHSTFLDEELLASPNAVDEFMVYIERLVEDIEPEFEVIVSDDMDTIIEESPYVMVVEIGEPFMLAGQYGITDMFYVTVLQSIRGEMPIHSELVITFFANTVYTGEQHIVATVPIDKGSSWHIFSSSNSLFGIEQLEEMLGINETTEGSLLSDDYE